MESMRTTLRRGRNVWNRVNMPEGEFRQRVEKIRSEMKKEDIDVLLVYGDAWIDYSDPCYITNYYPGMVGSIALVPRKGEVGLIFWGSARGIEYTQDITWIKEIKPASNVASTCVDYLKQAGLFPSTLGLAGFKQLMPYQQLQSFYTAINGCKTVDAGHFIRDMRMVKSSRERDQIHRAALILTGVFEALDRRAPEDMNELTLDAALDREARLGGAEDVRQLYALPQETDWTFRPVEDRQMASGDTIIIYLAAEFERYWAEIIRTFKVETSGLMEVRSEKLDDIYRRVTKLLTPGKATSKFYGEVEKEVRKSGAFIPEYGLGEGIGLSVSEPPLVCREDTNNFREGMCLTLRLAMKDDNEGAIMTGNTIYLSADGPEVFTR
ncbi:MAG: M24 family metallopeptidase [Pseudomonadota bacterium]